MDTVTHHALSADPHLLKLLGDELIGNDRLAVFELVKNAYDADATQVDVEVNFSSATPYIRIRDNGNGMTSDVIIKNWMRLGSGGKRGSKKGKSLILGRVPLGEKGVGRLAVQKLGSFTRLVTRSQDDKEYEVHVNWDSIANEASELTDLSFALRENASPNTFLGQQHGTVIEIRNLHRTEWTRRDLRALKRLLVSLKSPFDTVSDFDVHLTVPGREGEINDVLDIADILDRAVWAYRFSLRDDGSFDWEYHFLPPASLSKKLKKNDILPKDREDFRLKGIKQNPEEESIRPRKARESVYVTAEDLEGIGPIAGWFYLYDRRREAFAEGTFKQMRQYLDEQTGIRIFRNGVRVFNYGEQGDDWLMLNARRINTPVGRTGSNSIIAGVGLNLTLSSGLKEKTNREGFDENSAFLRLRWILQSLVEHVDKLRRQDRELLDHAIDGKALVPEDLARVSFETTVNELRDANRRGLTAEVSKKIDWIEREYKDMRDVMASGAGGQHLALVIHEVEREVNLLRRAIDHGESAEKLKERAGHVVGVLDAVSGLLRQSPKKKSSARQLLEKVSALNSVRFRHHKVSFSCPVLTGEDSNFELSGPLNLYMAALNNLIDNSIFWSRSETQIGSAGAIASIVVRVFPAWFGDGSNAIVVADNGPGLNLSQEDARRPFITTKPGGMGLGLYYASMVMETTGGDLYFGDIEEFGLPANLTGAVVVLRFKKV
jgi:signal transduction histidine kinase